MPDLFFGFWIQTFQCRGEPYNEQHTELTESIYANFGVELRAQASSLNELKL
jgi:hypothetical protein